MLQFKLKIRITFLFTMNDKGERGACLTRNVSNVSSSPIKASCYILEQEKWYQQFPCLALNIKKGNTSSEVTGRCGWDEKTNDHSELTKVKR